MSQILLYVQELRKLAVAHKKKGGKKWGSHKLLKASGSYYAFPIL